MKLSEIAAAQQLSVNLQALRELLDYYKGEGTAKSLRYQSKDQPDDDPWEVVEDDISLAELRLIMEPKLRQRISLVEEQLRALGVDLDC